MAVLVITPPTISVQHRPASTYIHVFRRTCIYMYGQHVYLLEVTKQQICMKYCSSVLYYQLLGSWSDVGYCVNLWFTSNKATALLPTNLLHVPDRTCNIYVHVLVNYMYNVHKYAYMYNVSVSCMSYPDVHHLHA